MNNRTAPAAHLPDGPRQRAEPRWRLSLALTCLLVCCLSLGAVQGGPVARVREIRPRVLVITLGQANAGTVESLIKGEEASSLLKGMEVVTVATSSPELVPLRVSLMPLPEPLPTSPSCVVESPGVAPLLATAERWLGRARPSIVAACLEQARRLVVEGRAPVTQAELSQMLFLQAILELDRQGSARQAFVTLLVVNPEFPAPDDYAPAIKNAFAEARQRVKQLSSIPVSVDSSGLAGLSLRVDGRPANGALSLLEGWHVLQVLDADGRVRGAQEVVLQAGQLAAVWPPTNLSTMRVAQLELLLTEALRRSQLGQATQTGLQRFLKERRYDGVLLVATRQDGQGSQGLLMGVDGKLTELKSGPEVTNNTQVKPWLPLALGGCALASGSVYGYSWYQGLEGTVPSLEAQTAFRVRAGVSGGVAAACLGGSLISWWLPRRALERPPTGKVSVRLQGLEVGTGLALQVRWRGAGAPAAKAGGDNVSRGGVAWQ